MFTWMVVKQFIKPPCDDPYDALQIQYTWGWCEVLPPMSTAVQLIGRLDYTPSPPPPLLVWSRANGITEQRLCWQRLRQHRAQGRPFTFHPPPTSPKPGNTGRRQGRADENVCQRTEGIESGFRAMGGREKSSKEGTARVVTFMQRYRKTFSNLNAYWMNQPRQPVGLQLKKFPGRVRWTALFVRDLTEGQS